MGMVTKVEAKRLVLFDAHAIVHRAYHALPEFSTKQGEPTGGLYGLSTMLLRAIAEFTPDYMAACYDLPGPTFRHKEYKAYKAGRAKADDELKQQLGRSRNIFTAFHIPIYDAPGFEADDMLGTIVEQTKKEKDLEVLIVTGDMDTLQLVSGKRVRVYTLKKGINDTVVYDEKGVNDRFGFGPELLPDYKGLRGDPSDNIVGIAGISLVVGGVGIMNAMFTAVLERTREIGVMKAIGARNDQILKLFLIESGMIGLIGGAIGIIIGIGLSKIVEFIGRNFLGTILLRAYFPWYLILGALAFAFIIGTISGLLPARSAARSSPVDALRYE